MNFVDFEVSLRSIWSLSTSLTVRSSASLFSSRIVSFSKSRDRPLDENLRRREVRSAKAEVNTTEGTTREEVTRACSAVVPSQENGLLSGQPLEPARALPSPPASSKVGHLFPSCRRPRALASLLPFVGHPATDSALLRSVASYKNLPTANCSKLGEISAKLREGAPRRKAGKRTEGIR